MAQFYCDMILGQMESAIGKVRAEMRCFGGFPFGKRRDIGYFCNTLTYDNG